MYSKLQDGSFVICGYVAKDAELKHVGEKKSSLCTWSVKVSEKNGNKGANWTNCKAWHSAARFAANIKKGDTVLCIGKIEANEHEGVTYKNLVCEYISIMGKSNSAASAAPPSTVIDPETVDLNEFEEILSDGEVPF